MLRPAYSPRTISCSGSLIYTTRATCTKAARLAAYSAGEGEQQPRAPVDEDVARCTSYGSTVLAPTRTQSIYLADMCGDGLTEWVRLRNGEVCYGPNLGYGRFGAKVTMDCKL